MDDHFDMCPYLRFLHYVLWHIDLFTFLFIASIHRNIINNVFSMIMGLLKIMRTLEIGASAFCIMKIHGSVEVKDRMMWLEDVYVFESLVPSWSSCFRRLSNLEELKTCYRKWITGISPGFHSPDMSLVHSLFLSVPVFMFSLLLLSLYHHNEMSFSRCDPHHFFH